MVFVSILECERVCVSVSVSVCVCACLSLCDLGYRVSATPRVEGRKEGLESMIKTRCGLALRFVPV